MRISNPKLMVLALPLFLAIVGCTSDEDAHWSDFRIAYSRSEGTGIWREPFGRLTIFDVRTQTARSVTGVMRDNMRCAWSPDGNFIAFRNPQISTKPRLLVLGEDSQVYFYFYDLKKDSLLARKSLTARTGLYVLCWDVDGKTVFYTDWENTLLGYSIERDSAWTERIFPQFEAILTLNLSSDGRLFGLSCVLRDAQGDLDKEIAVLDRRSGELRILEWATRRMVMGGWSPDGHRVLVLDRCVQEYDYDTDKHQTFPVAYDSRHHITSIAYAGPDTLVFLADDTSAKDVGKTDVGFCTRSDPKAQWLTTDYTRKNDLTVYYRRGQQLALDPK